MLTIKHIEMDGHESVMSAVSVSFNAEKNELTGFGSPGPDEGSRKDGVIVYGSGHIYVMNENGKTVAAYNLEKK